MLVWKALWILEPFDRRAFLNPELQSVCDMRTDLKCIVHQTLINRVCLHSRDTGPSTLTELYSPAKPLSVGKAVSMQVSDKDLAW